MVFTFVGTNPRQQQMALVLDPSRVPRVIFVLLVRHVVHRLVASVHNCTEVLEAELGVADVLAERVSALVQRGQEELVREPAEDALDPTGLGVDAAHGDALAPDPPNVLGVLL